VIGVALGFATSWK